MKDGEPMADFEERFTSIVIELSVLGKVYTNREVIVKAMRALPREWEVKTVAMKESKDLNKIEPLVKKPLLTIKSNDWYIHQSLLRE